MSVNEFNSLPVSQYTIKTVSLSVINQATQTVTVLFKSKLTVRCES